MEGKLAGAKDWRVAGVGGGRSHQYTENWVLLLLLLFPVSVALPVFPWLVSSCSSPLDNMVLLLLLLW